MEKLNFNDPDAMPGVILKSATVAPLEITDSDLAKINKYSLVKLTADEVFVFKATIADNEQDDRNYMPFNAKALKDLKKLYLGKTVIKDHKRSADNQIGRIFDTELVETDKLTELEENHVELVAKIYMIRTESNKDLITEISGGIKKEVSTSTVPEKMVCSICGTDNMKDWCRHWPGREYDVTDARGKTAKQRCKMLLHGAKEAYELSLVAVPAQPRAGAHKSVGFTKPVEEPKTNPEKEIENVTDKLGERILKARIKSATSFFNANKEAKENE